jgi:hypothetical protein
VDRIDDTEGGGGGGGGGGRGEKFGVTRAFQSLRGTEPTAFYATLGSRTLCLRPQ